MKKRPSCAAPVFPSTIRTRASLCDRGAVAEILAVVDHDTDDQVAVGRVRVRVVERHHALAGRKLVLKQYVPDGGRPLGLTTSPAAIPLIWDGLPVRARW